MSLQQTDVEITLFSFFFGRVWRKVVFNIKISYDIFKREIRHIKLKTAVP